MKNGIWQWLLSFFRKKEHLTSPLEAASIKEQTEQLAERAKKLQQEAEAQIAGLTLAITRLGTEVGNLEETKKRIEGWQ